MGVRGSECEGAKGERGGVRVRGGKGEGGKGE